MEGDEASGWKPGKPDVFLAGPYNEAAPAFSPDGRWLAYQSNESRGRYEVFVVPFLALGGGKWQISTAGGQYPTWAPNSKELFYRTDDQKIMAATYAADGDSFRPDKPRPWSEGQFTDRGFPYRNFDFYPKGQRFAVLKAPETQAARMDKVVLILNFFDELRRLAPPKR